MSTAVAKRKAEEETVPAPSPSIADNLLPMLREILTNPAISPERVTQTLDFYERMDRMQGKKAFDAALADAKAEFNPIVKKHLVQYGEGVRATKYKHEDLFDVLAAVEPALSKHGVIVRYRATSNINEPVRVTCVVSHRGGYSEETTLTAGADNSGAKNSIQQIGSTLTYLQRYTLRLALGLAASRDDDGQAAGGDTVPPSNGTIDEKQVAEIQALCIAKGTKLPIFFKIFGISDLREMTAAQYGVAKNMLNMKQGQK